MDLSVQDAESRFAEAAAAAARGVRVLITKHGHLSVLLGLYRAILVVSKLSADG